LVLFLILAMCQTAGTKLFGMDKSPEIPINIFIDTKTGKEKQFVIPTTMKNYWIKILYKKIKNRNEQNNFFDDIIASKKGFSVNYDQGNFYINFFDANTDANTDEKKICQIDRIIFISNNINKKQKLSLHLIHKEKNKLGFKYSEKYYNDKEKKMLALAAAEGYVQKLNLENRPTTPDTSISYYSPLDIIP